MFNIQFKFNAKDDVFQFGTHKGKSVEVICNQYPSYFNWFANQLNTNDNSQLRKRYISFINKNQQNLNDIRTKLYYHNNQHYDWDELSEYCEGDPMLFGDN